MKKFTALFFALLCATYAHAQPVTQQPQSIATSTVVDFGNGPLELRAVAGPSYIFTSQGSGVGSTSGSSTALTLTGTPTTPPCVGCQISGAGINSGTTVAAYNGTTGVTLSAAMSVPASTALSWGAACPSTTSGLTKYIQAQPGVDYWQLYTSARICAGSAGGPQSFVLAQPYSPTGNSYNLAPNSVLGSLLGGVPVSLPVASCSSANQSLNWTAGGGFGCVTIAPGATNFNQLAGAATNAQLAPMPTNTTKCNQTTGSAAPTDCVPVVFKLGKNGVDQTGLIDSTYTLLTWSTTPVNSGGGSLISSSFLVPQPGYYHLDTVVYFTAGVASTATPTVLVKFILNSPGVCNGADIFAVPGTPTVGSPGFGIASGGGVTGLLAANDSIQLCAYVTSTGGNVVQVNGNDAHTHVSGHRIR